MIRTSLLAAVPVLLIGCASATPPIEDAVRSYSAAFLSGQTEEAAGMMSARCNTPTVRAQITQAAAVAPVLYDTAKLVSVTPVVDSDRATVTYRFDQPAIDQENEPSARTCSSWASATEPLGARS